MNILENLHKTFSVDANEPAAKTKDIELLIKYSCIDVPEDYISLVKSMTEVEIIVDENKYVRIWSPLGCIEMNNEYNIQTYIPTSLAIGDDEEGSALILMSGNKGFGLYKVGFGDLDIDDADYIACSLGDLLTKGIGIHNLS